MELGLGMKGTSAGARRIRSTDLLEGIAGSHPPPYQAGISAYRCVHLLEVFTGITKPSCACSDPVPTPPVPVKRHATRRFQPQSWSFPELTYSEAATLERRVE